MKIRFSAEARLVIKELEAFIESKNTGGAGKRFRIRFLNQIKKILLNHSNHPLCKYTAYYLRNLRCFFIEKWVIAYGKEDNEIVIYAIVFGPLLEY